MIPTECKRLAEDRSGHPTWNLGVIQAPYAWVTRSLAP